MGDGFSQCGASKGREKKSKVELLLGDIRTQLIPAVRKGGGKFGEVLFKLKKTNRSRPRARGLQCDLIGAGGGNGGRTKFS